MAKKSTSSTGDGGPKATAQKGNIEKELLSIRYSDADLKEFRDIIEEKLKTLREDVKSFKGVDISEMHIHDRRDHNTRLSKLNKDIEDLENALLQIGTKKYGICTVCGQLIEKSRLKLVPTATTMVECAQKTKNVYVSVPLAVAANGTES